MTLCYLRYVTLYPRSNNKKKVKNIPGGGNGEFFRGTRQLHVRGVDSASKNEYQDIPGGKDGPYGWQPTNLHVPMSRKLGALTSQNPLAP
jgi:hypothetical protein